MEIYKLGHGDNFHFNCHISTVTHWTCIITVKNISFRIKTKFSFGRGSRRKWSNTNTSNMNMTMNVLQSCSKCVLLGDFFSIEYIKVTYFVKRNKGQLNAYIKTCHTIYAKQNILQSWTSEKNKMGWGERTFPENIFRHSYYRNRKLNHDKIIPEIISKLNSHILQNILRKAIYFWPSVAETLYLSGSFRKNIV